MFIEKFKYIHSCLFYILHIYCIVHITTLLFLMCDLIAQAIAYNITLCLKYCVNKSILIYNSHFSQPSQFQMDKITFLACFIYKYSFNRCFYLKRLTNE